MLGPLPSAPSADHLRAPYHAPTVAICTECGALYDLQFPCTPALKPALKPRLPSRSVLTLLHIVVECASQTISLLEVLASVAVPIAFVAVRAWSAQVGDAVVGVVAASAVVAAAQRGGGLIAARRPP